MQKKRPASSKPSLRTMKGGSSSSDVKEKPNATDMLEEINQALKKKSKQDIGWCGCGGGTW